MRLVACDLDGTVVRPDGTVSQRTLAALEQCRRQGVETVFVTGRPPRWMEAVAQVTGRRGLALCANGAVVLDLDGGAVVHSWPLSAWSVRTACATLRSEIPDSVFGLETLTGYRRESAYVPVHAATAAVVADDVDGLLLDDPVVVKVLCRQARDTAGALVGPSPLGADEMLAIARRELAGVVEAVHSDSANGMLEMSAPGVTKASALGWLAASMRIDAQDVVAFGDMPNDVPMLRWAGAGYAMADGHPEAIAAALALAPPCAEDGVAQVLERLLAAGAAAGGRSR